jgi:hypothetical protein
VQVEEDLVEARLLQYAQRRAAKWGAERFAAEFRRRELEERWLEASKTGSTPYTPADEVSGPDAGSGPIDASTEGRVVGAERDAWSYERPKHARHASVPRPPEAAAAPTRSRFRTRKRDRTEKAWTISPAEAAGMSAAGRKLYGLD